MAQISKGDTFVDGQQVTGARLNQLVDSATLSVGAITEQTSLTANTLESADGILVNDSGTLKKATIGDILNSNLDATIDVAEVADLKTGVINGKTNTDVNMTPQDGVIVTSKAFTSVDGITAVVTSTGHGLESGMMLEFSASNAVYSGQYVITVLSVDTFSYVISQTTPVAASGTLSYTKKGSVKISGSVNVTNKLTVGSSSEFNGNIVSKANFTNSGTANFTGEFKINGTVGYSLYEIFEANVFYSNATVPVGWNAMYTSASLTKPSDEIWVIEADLRWRRTLAQVWSIRINQTTPNTMLNGIVDIEGGGGDYWHIESGILRYVFNTGTTFTSTITIDVLPVSSAGYAFYCGETNYTTAGTALNSVTFSPSKFRIYKYKTA